MAPESESRLRKIKRASIVARCICDVLLAVVGLVGIGAVLDIVSGIGGINLPGWFFNTATLSLGHRLALAFSTAAAWGILLNGFLHLRRLFSDFTRGQIFTRHSVRQLRWFGVACLLWSVLNNVWMLSLAVSLHPIRTFPGNTNGFGAGIVIVVIAWFMDMAVDLKEESEFTI